MSSLARGARRGGRSTGASSRGRGRGSGRDSSNINNNNNDITPLTPIASIAETDESKFKSKSKKDLLYARCAEQAAAAAAAANTTNHTSTNNNSTPTTTNTMSDRDAAFTQADLMGMGIAADLPQLMSLCQALVSAHRFQIVEVDGQICYRVRALDFAQRLEALEARELLVYNHIDQASTAGIWTKTLKARTNLHQTVMTRVLKSLESQNFIKQTKLVKHPGRKIYMRYDLDPGDEATGGPWYSDGELDVEFVDSIAAFIVDHVQRNSWREGPRFTPASFAPSKARATKVTAQTAVATAASGTTNKSKGSTAMNNNNNNNTTAQHAADASSIPLLPDSPLLLSKPAYPHLSNAYHHNTEIDHVKDPRFYGPALNHRGRILVPYEPGYMGYPTAPEILTFIDATGIVKGKDLTTPDLRVLLDMLVFDRKLERVGRKRVRPDDEHRRLKRFPKISSVDHESGDDDEDEDEDEDYHVEEIQDGEDDSENSHDDDDDDDDDDDHDSAPRKRKQEYESHQPLAKRRKKSSSAAGLSKSKYSSSSSAANAEWKLEYMYRAVRWPAMDGSSPSTAVGAGGATAPATDPAALLDVESRVRPGNGFTEAPCSRCPVFRLCEEGGPADARSCAYFEDWLRS